MTCVQSRVIFTTFRQVLDNFVGFLSSVWFYNIKFSASESFNSNTFLSPYCMQPGFVSVDGTGMKF